MSNRFRRWTATEEIADALEDWLDEVKPAHEVMLDKDGISSKTATKRLPVNRADCEPVWNRPGGRDPGTQKRGPPVP